MQSLRNGISALLDKVDALLKSEPARLIGYGAAVVIYLVGNFLASKGILNIPAISAEDAMTDAIAAVAVLVALVESIRRFVYSPLTYIEDLSDAVKQGHVEAHAEEEFQRVMAEAVKTAKASKRVAVGTVKAAGSGDASN